MVIFQREEIVHHKKGKAQLEELSIENQKEVALKTENEIRKHHKHSDGSAVVLSVVEPSKIEMILSDEEKNFIKLQTEIDASKYESKSDIEHGSKGLYLSETKAHIGPVFVCTCGAGFSAGRESGSALEIYKIEDYHESSEEGSYAHKPEPISDSYAQIIKYK